jgi:hypothetical protein
MNQALNIRQTNDVATYCKEFETIMHQLLSHNSALDDTFFVTKFIKGLRKDIRSAIILHKPRIVDAAISLAQLQETQLADDHKNSYTPKRWHNTARKGIMGVHPAEAITSKNKDNNISPLTSKFDTLRA